MLSSRKLKICKVESRAFAKYCLLRGADYLGIHDLEAKFDDEKRELVECINKLGGKPIVLTKVKDLKVLQKLADFYKPWALQLHFQTTLDDVIEVEKATGLPVVPVFTDDSPVADVKAQLKHVKLAIYDTSYVGGTGQQHSQKLLKTLAESELSSLLLAGGVSPDLIHADKSGVGGYDVQSYCRQDGTAHYGRAETLFDTVKGRSKNQLSISLTDVEPGQVKTSYIDSDCLEYQVDYSEGGLYKHFSVPTERIKQHMLDIDAPFTLHIFESDLTSFQRVIDDFFAVAGNKIVRINIQYSEGLNPEKLQTYTAKRCDSIYYKDLKAYTAGVAKSADCLSFIMAADLEDKKKILANKSELPQLLADKEVWFDRRVDIETAKEVLKSYPDANFIVGDYIIKSWENEAKILEALKK